MPFLIPALLDKQNQTVMCDYMIVGATPKGNEHAV